MPLADPSGRRALLALAPYPLRPFVFTAWTGVAEASLKGTMVVGRWLPHPQTLRLDRTIAFLEEYANWPDQPGSIQEFARRYGPLKQPFLRGGRFQFSVQTWRREQTDFRRRWEAEMLQGRKVVSFSFGQELKAQAGEEFSWNCDDLSDRAATIHRLLILNLYSQPPARLRKCTRPDCPNPYFLADRLKRTYCSEVCANSAQRAGKRDYWAKRGSEARREKKKADRKASP